MKNVCASTALSPEVYRGAKEAAALHGITLSSFISLAIGHLLHMEPDERAALCDGARRDPKRLTREAADD